jgi:hypothetical protein
MPPPSKAAFAPLALFAVLAASASRPSRTGAVAASSRRARSGAAGSTSGAGSRRSCSTRSRRTAERAKPARWDPRLVLPGGTPCRDLPRLGQTPGAKTAWLLGSHQVRPAGFEPATHRLEVCCSVRLSYGRIRRRPRYRRPAHDAPHQHHERRYPNDPSKGSRSTTVRSQLLPAAHGIARATRAPQGGRDSDHPGVPRGITRPGTSGRRGCALP